MEEQKNQFKEINISKEAQLKWFVKTYPKLRTVSKIQLEKIKKHKQSKIHPKEVLHIYLYSVFESFWDKADFFIR